MILGIVTNKVIFDAIKGECDFEFIIGNSLYVAPELCDFLFLDTYHSYRQMKAELDIHGVWAAEIGIHDTKLYGEVGEDEKLGINFAIHEWLSEHKDYRITYHSDECCGLIILTRQ